MNVQNAITGKCAQPADIVRPQYVTPAYIARRYGVSTQTVNKWIRDGIITPDATYIAGYDNQIRSLFHGVPKIGEGCEFL